MYSQESAKMVYVYVAVRITVRTNNDMFLWNTWEQECQNENTLPNLYGSVQNDTNVYNSSGFDPLAKAFYMVMLKTELFMSNYSVFLDTSTAQSVVLLCISIDPYEVSIKKKILWHLPTCSNLAVSPKGFVTTTLLW